MPTPEDPPPPPAEPVSTKPWLGVSRWWVNGRDVELCGVLSDGPAGKAGLQPEDVIQTIAGKPIRSLNEFHEIIEDCDAGGEVVVEFRRDGQKQSVTVSMEAMPSDGGTGRMLAAAERGEPWAMMEMGVRYAHMRGERSYCEKDYARAVQWFGKADQAQHISAAYFLGLMYDRGNGVEQDYAEAKGLYERTRRLEGQGPRQSAFLSATRALAILYLSGHGVAQDDQMAEKLLREAADLGCLKALTHVAWMYENGRGGSGRRLSTKEYHKEAVDLYYEAAKQGYSLAQFNLGVACLEGKIVKQSNEMAVGWFRLAAEQGYGKAMYNVGWMYEQGRGVPQDRQTAITWYRKALEDGYEDARKPLEALGVSTGQAASTDLDLIQGTWECVAAFEDGKPAESFAGVLAVFEGNRLTWKRMPIEGSQTIEATFTLDPTKDPKHLDWVPNGSTDAHKRIYSLDEDTLRMSTNFGSNPRPASFEAGKWQFVMKRVKPTE
ncbi:MAG: SEL1-like repeat protein [Planctomycetes bacterium]|nr:SEL1-like repeat protein [Planctomycetota bacterium]